MSDRISLASTVMDDTDDTRSSSTTTLVEPATATGPQDAIRSGTKYWLDITQGHVSPDQVPKRLRRCSPPPYSINVEFSKVNCASQTVLDWPELSKRHASAVQAKLSPGSGGPSFPTIELPGWHRETNATNFIETKCRMAFSELVSTFERIDAGGLPEETPSPPTLDQYPTTRNGRQVMWQNPDRNERLRQITFRTARSGEPLPTRAELYFIQAEFLANGDVSAIDQHTLPMSRDFVQ